MSHLMCLDSLAEHLCVPGDTGYRFHTALIDSRSAGPGSLFFALPGSRTDGHCFVEEVLRAGSAAVVSREGFSGPVLRVPNVEEALFQAGRWARSRFKCPVVAVTGSSGKTTTRELILLALRSRMKAGGTIENRNNRLGLPLTLLNTRDDISVLVLEMGMNHAGELLELGEAAMPDTTVITNIGSAHIEFFKDRDGIASAKAELLRTTRRGGNAVIPRGEPILLEAARERNLKIVTTGPGGDAWVENGLLMPWNLSPGLRIPGEHNLANALTALAASTLFGVDPAAASEAMGGYRGMAGRGRILCCNGVTVFDESYNANPESTLACLEMLKDAGLAGIAVLGDMLELGDHAGQAHDTVLARASGMGLRKVVLVGQEFLKALRRAASPNVEWVPNPEAALELLRETIGSGDRVLVKGSHSLGLSLVVSGLREGDG
jgi:UDP-N-acetylmuramoyl-tripeptide--D-alanyl-D-alanine ligase